MNILELLGIILLVSLASAFIYWFIYVTMSVKNHEQDIEKLENRCSDNYFSIFKIRNELAIQQDKGKVKNESDSNQV